MVLAEATAERAAVALPSYRCARDLFDAARDAAIERASIMRQLDAIRASASLRGVRYDSASVSGTSSDHRGDARLAAMIDQQQRLHDRLADNEALLSACADILYGRDGNGGVARAVGSPYADVLFWRYLDGTSWDAAASMVGVSRASAIRCAAVALDAIDSYGLGRILQGTGIAAD